MSGKFPAFLPRVDAANHTLRTPNIIRLCPRNTKYLPLKTSESPQIAIWPPDIWKTILLSV